jgi:hypothetical protein
MAAHPSDAVSQRVTPTDSSGLGMGSGAAALI